MKTIFIIAKKEFLTYFYTPIAYVIASVFYIINGLLFSYLINDTSSNDVYREGSVMQYIFSNDFFWIILFILIPVITMRLIAEEKKEGTLELILTFPVNDLQLILGKFFGAFLFYIFLWLPTFIYVGLLFWISPPDLGPIFSAFLGVLLAGAMFISIGLFFSTLTKNQIISSMLCFGFILSLLIISAIEYVLPPGNIRFLLQYINFVKHSHLLSIGGIDTRNIVYFLSFIFFFIFLSTMSLEARKWSK